MWWWYVVTPFLLGLKKSEVDKNPSLEGDVSCYDVDLKACCCWIKQSWAPWLLSVAGWFPLFHSLFQSHSLAGEMVKRTRKPKILTRRTKMISAEIISLNHHLRDKLTCHKKANSASGWMRTVRQLSTKSPYLPCQIIPLLSSNAKLTLIFKIFLTLFYLPWIKPLSQWQDQGIKSGSKPLQTEQEHPCCLILRM